MLLNVHLDVNISVLYYICYKLTPLEKHCSKAKVLLTLHSNSTVLEESTAGVYMSRSKRLDYKQLNETEKVEKEEVESDQIEEVSNLFRTISISEDLKSLNLEESMNKQKADALVIDEATIWEDIDDYIDENDIKNMLSIEEFDGKLQQIEELRTTYRIRHSKLKVVLGSNYEDSYAEDGKKRLKSVKNHIMKANMVRRDMSERKLILDTKIIALKKRSKE